MAAQAHALLIGGRRSVRELVGLTVLAVVASLLAWVTVAPPAAAEEPTPSGSVPCGYGLVCNGEAPVTGDIAPITVSGLDPWNRIVQSPAAAAWYSLEAQATAMVAALHGVPNSRRVTLWARDEVRAMMFALLLEAIDKPTAERTVQEQEWLTTMQAVLRQRRVDTAQRALDEYDRWNANPCTYTPPFSYTTPPVRPQCALGGGGQLTAIAGTSWDSPPSLAQFQAYGAALANNAAFGSADAVQAITDSTAALTFFAGAAAAGVLATLAAVIVGTVPALAAAVGTAIGSGVLATAALTTTSSLGALAGSLGGTVVAVGAVAGSVAMAVVGIIVVAIRSWQISESLSLPNKLAKAKYDAKNQGIDLHQVVHDDCGDAPDGCGKLELYTAMLAQTLPDYAAERAAAQTEPVRRAHDPYFEMFDESGRWLDNVATITPQGADSLSMSDGWFIRDNFFDPARYTFQSTYIDWNGNQKVVSLHGEGFVTRNAIGTPGVTGPSPCFDLMTQGEKRRACWHGNHAPTIAPTISENPVEGSPVTFTANASDEDGGPLSYLWTFEDPAGSFALCVDYLGEADTCSWRSAPTPEATLTYPNDGLQHAKLVVTDSTGLSTTQSFAFRVGNVKPTLALDAASPSTVPVGSATTISGTVTDVGHDKNTLTVDWGDGTTSTQEIVTCQPVPIQGCVDPNSWDSAALGTRSFEFTHTYIEDPRGLNNVYHPTVTAHDGSGRDSASTPVNVTPSALRVILANSEQLELPRIEGDNRAVQEGQDGEVAEVSGWVSTPGRFIMRVDWGDGNESGIGCDPGCGLLDDNRPDGMPFLICDGPCSGGFFHLQHFYADGPSHPTITVTVTDDNDQVVSARATVGVSNVAPTVRFTDGGGSSATAGEPYTLQAALRDPGDDTFISAIDWGDGSAPTECLEMDCLWPWINGEHTYDGPGRYEVTVTVTDDDGGTGQVVRTLDVAPAGNVAPTAAGRSATTDEDTAVTVTPLGHDANGDELTYAAGQPEHGSVEVTGEGLVYTPSGDYFGPDSFTYTADDGQLTSEPATVSVTVNAVDDPPDAENTQVETDEDRSVEVDPSATDVDGEPVTFELLTAPTHGTLLGTAAPWTYVPDADYHGADGFDYAVKSGTHVVVRTASITVQPVNDRPTAQNATEQTAEDTARTFTPQTGDADGDDLTLTIVDQPAHGSAEVTAAGQLRYVPAAHYSGPDSFTYRASDGELVSAPATVSIIVSAVNDPPTVETVPDVAATYTDPITPITIEASDAETPTGGLIFSQTGLPAGLTLAAGGTISGRVTAAPASYAVSVKVCDGDQGCKTVSFTIQVQPETAVVRLTPNNPHAVATVKGAAPAMTFTGRITDSADGSFGDVGRIARADLGLALTPVGGGRAVSCAPTVVRRVAATATTPGFVAVRCTVAAGAKVDVYDVSLEVTGHFAGSDASVLTVYDPKARGASGAGSVLLANGNLGEFAFAAAAVGKKAKGKVVFLEKTVDGAAISTVRGTAFQTLAVGTGSPRPAAFTGKAVANGIGNYSYVVKVADAGATGDTFALRLTAPSGAPSLDSLSFAALPVRPGGALSVR